MTVGDCGATTPAAEIAEVLARRIPGADVDRLTARIAELKLSLRHAVGLLAHLEAHPDALSSGDATGSAALRRLLDVLAADHPAVQRMRCHNCGAQTELRYRRDGASICGGCYRQTHMKVCVRCGQMGHPDIREGDGIVCTRCRRNDPDRKHPCARCGTVALVAYRIDGRPFCQKCGPHRLHTCSSCGRREQRAHAMTAHGPICPNCYRRGREHQCVQCGRTTTEARRADPESRTWICYRCWTPPTMTCTNCGQLKPCARGSASGKPLCSTCSSRRPPRTCAVCARSVQPQTTLPVGPVCGRCYRKIRRHPHACVVCGETRPLVGVNDAGHPTCGPCCGDTRNWVCRDCGRIDLLIAGTLCLTCNVKDRVRQLLTGADGHIRPQLGGVSELLLDEYTPEQTQEILNGCQWIRLLGKLIATGEPITHDALDQLGCGLHVHHLRHVLVYAGALDERGEGPDGLEPWLRTLLSTLPSGCATVMQRYASWSLLPRTRRRAARGQTKTSTLKYVRTQVLVAHQFLQWLTANQLSLADTTQHDVDTWLRQGASTRLRLRDFMRWASARGLVADLEVRWLGRQGLPEQILDEDQRWALLRRCLRDATLSLRLRTAGALVLLYGQIPTRIVELTVSEVTTAQGDVYLRLRDRPVLLPPPLAAVVTQLIAANAQPSNGQRVRPHQVWLFPGARAGAHLDSGHLTKQLNEDIGIFVRPARGAALSDLAGTLPAPVLAELLGISISAAARWTAVAGSDYADYLAACRDLTQRQPHDTHD